MSNSGRECGDAHETRTYLVIQYIEDDLYEQKDNAHGKTPVDSEFFDLRQGVLHDQHDHSEYHRGYLNHWDFDDDSDERRRACWGSEVGG